MRTSLNYFNMARMIISRAVIATLTCYLYSGKTIEKSETVKDLGVVIDESLNWSQHIKEVTRQCSQMSAWILRTFTTRSALPLMTLYKSLVRSRVDYCCPVWSTVTKQNLCAVEAIQRSFTARISSFKDLNYWERLKKLHLMSLQRRRERYIILHMFKLYTGITNNDIGLKFHWNMRLGPMCVVPTLNTKSKAVQTLQYNSFSTMGPMLFNRMPRMMKESVTLAAFKTSLDEYLMKIPDTPPTPGFYDNNLLNSSLFKVNSKKFQTADCECNQSIQDPYHVLLECSFSEPKLKESCLSVMSSILSPAELNVRSHLTLLNCSRNKEFISIVVKILQTSKLKLRKKVILKSSIDKVSNADAITSNDTLL